VARKISFLSMLGPARNVLPRETKLLRSRFCSNPLGRFCCETAGKNIAAAQAHRFQHWNWIRQSFCVAERSEGADVEPLGRNGP
jgi:hypothetical protein